MRTCIVVVAMAAAFVTASCTTTPALNRYPQSACVRYVHQKQEFKADVNWCASYVELHGNTMEVRVSWELLQLSGGTEAIFQITDEYNRRMYLTDESGHRYDHARVSGAALGSRYRIGSLQSGSYFFPLPGAGVRRFQFHDDENGAQLEIHL